MAEHLTPKQVEEYSRQQLGVAELLSVSDHLGGCESCRQRIEYGMNGDAALVALRAGVFGEVAAGASSPLARAHLTAEQTAGYVDKNLSGEELQTVADHLTHCEPCALAVNDLDAFKNQVAPALAREYYPATASLPTEGFWQRTFGALAAPFRHSPRLAFSAALAILLLAVTGWLIWQAAQGGGPKPEMVEALPSPPAPAPVPAPVPAPAPPSVPVVAQLNDGAGQLTLDQEGKLAGAGDLPPAYQRLLKEALTTRKIEKSSQLRGLSRPPSSLMSTDKQQSEFSVIEPTGKVLLSDHPTFRWLPLEGATRYIVEVYDSQFNLAATSPELASPVWASSQSLARGQVYSWQVKAFKDGQEFTAPRPPAPQARFRVLDQAKAHELAQARRAYPASHLTLGLLYAEAGLLKEAEQELRALQKANPDSEVARSLLSQVQALRRKSD